MIMQDMTPLIIPQRQPGARINLILLRELAEQGKTETQIARLMGFEINSIRQQLRRLGLRAGGRPVSQIDVEKLRALYDSGMPVREIATTLGLAQSNIENHIRKHGFPKRRRAKANVAAEVPVAAEAETKVTEEAIPVEAEADVTVVGDVPAPPSTPDLTGQVLATKGRYAALAEFAQRHNLTQTRALQLYHAARVMR
jgi:hypothetical protein